MVQVNRMELGRELAQTLIGVNQEIEIVKAEAKEHGVDPYRMRDKNGMWIMVPLLVAKSNCLHALVMNQQKDR